MMSNIVELDTSSGFSSSSNSVITFTTCCFYEMKANNEVGPYKLVELGSKTDHPMGVVISLNHSDIKEAVKKIDHLRSIFVSNEQGMSKAENQLSSYIANATSCAFDSSQLIDFHEKLLLSEAVPVARVRPLIQNPGLFMITDEHVYFQPVQVNNVGDAMQCIDLSKVAKVYCRRYLLRQTGLEFLMCDGSSTLFTFDTRAIRDKIYKILISPASDTNNQQDKTLDSFTRKWQNREMTTFDYLMYLNNEADRSVNDLTQYPVFPHIIADYDSDQLDLEDPDTFRDLTKPIGALNSAHQDNGIPPPFLYGTHYSTPGYVLHYLFDAPDRMFYSMKATWESCLQNPTDLKELIPEFFCGTGEFLNNIELPPWSKRPQDFIRKQRKALESDYVSENIHHWIDLIFGYKQKGQEAVDADNLYYYLTYEGSVDLENEHDLRRRAALEIQIQEFGQTPKQLFAGKHPGRNDFTATVELCDNINVNCEIETAMKEETEIKFDDEIMNNHNENVISRHEITFPASDDAVTFPANTRTNKEENGGSDLNTLPSSKMGSLLNSGLTKTANFFNTVGSSISDNLKNISKGILKSTSAKKVKELKMIKIRLKAFELFNAHTDAVNAISTNKFFNDDNVAVVCSCSSDGTMKIFYLPFPSEDSSDISFQLHRNFISEGNTLEACSLMRDCKCALVAGSDNHCYTYSISNACATGKQPIHDDSVSSMSFVDDASKINSRYGTNVLLTGAYDGSVKLFKIQHNNAINPIPIAEFEAMKNNHVAVVRVALKEDVKYAAIGTDDGKLVIWEITTRRIVSSNYLSSNKQQIVGICWTTQDRLICASRDGCITYIDLSPTAIASAAMGFSSTLSYKTIDTEIHCMRLFSAHSEPPVSIICGCKDGSIRIYSTSQTHEISEIYRFPRAHECAISAIDVAEAPVGSTMPSLMITGGTNGTLRAWCVLKEGVE
eukprot:GSChrysophyteH1.ASY1.ANO1.1747.1 assembled CDS